MIFGSSPFQQKKFHKKILNFSCRNIFSKILFFEKMSIFSVSNCSAQLAQRTQLGRQKIKGFSLFLFVAKRQTPAPGRGTNLPPTLPPSGSQTAATTPQEGLPARGCVSNCVSNWVSNWAAVQLDPSRARREPFPAQLSLGTVRATTRPPILEAPRGV